MAESDREKMGEDEEFHRLEFRLEDSEEKGRSGEDKNRRCTRPQQGMLGTGVLAFLTQEQAEARLTTTPKRHREEA